MTAHWCLDKVVLVLMKSVKLLRHSLKGGGCPVVLRGRNIVFGSDKQKKEKKVYEIIALE